MKNIIIVKDLKKRFGELQAVKGIDFYVEKGKLFAFLGPNGAGKSTTIDILCTLLKPDCGEIMIDGHVLGKEDAAIRNSIGVVFQESVLDPLLTVQENLITRARFYKMSKSQIIETVEKVGVIANVTEFINRPYGKLSGGQRRRADIARALVNTPKILFLDEPTTGLDPKTKESVWKTIYDLQKKTGMTIFLTTHYMEEAATADFIIIINHGEIVAKGTPYNLQEKHSSDTMRMKPKDVDKIKDLLNEAQFHYQEKNGLIIADISETMDSIPILNKAKPFLESFEVIHGSMEDVFLNITGGEYDA
ncbi:ATP-binding cassette domain-containing protein [Acetobacterium paludosum]|uniref:ATP-binding cassette domain-containing protein n=1 Tax=Acetobacterium paludosum TaxID=52693 RepID=A0A923I025_9FIRM|nr:ABC transporter ATP-binding protein [Acetobacterium paludosum]MBC3889779.1 ATP-binding cassette domain-containing protein [Acetobacterium paludosum]